MDFKLKLLEKSVYKNERSGWLVHFIFHFHFIYFTVNYIKKCYLQSTYIFNNYITLH